MQAIQSQAGCSNVAAGYSTAAADDIRSSLHQTRHDRCKPIGIYGISPGPVGGLNRDPADGWINRGVSVASRMRLVVSMKLSGVSPQFAPTICAPSVAITFANVSGVVRPAWPRPRGSVR